MKWLLIVQALYFFLPAYIANMSPVIFKWVPLFNTPIWEKKLGKHKTWRGLIIGTVVGTFVFWLQKLAFSNGFESLALIDYNDFSLLLGFFLGLGAMLGDMAESYLKRQRNIAPGEPWMPWDQLDFVFGGLLLSFLVYVPQAGVVLTLIVLSPLLHVLFNYLGYLLHIHKNKL
ncbi:MAG TPA: CDP-archaeol synthase [Candidatus Nanoarchaeia archaeon]|nr:CDP-archaeol synthase [Candidatus Nanoarchaeia archaeon]